MDNHEELVPLGKNDDDKENKTITIISVSIPDSHMFEPLNIYWGAPTQKQTTLYLTILRMFNIKWALFQLYHDALHFNEIKMSFAFY